MPFLKVHKIENFFDSDYKILVKNFFDWTIMGGATIIPRSLGLRGMKNIFKIGQKFFFLNPI
jgi:hypothetical protein